MSKCDVDRVTRLVARVLGINGEFRGFQLENWGEVDRGAELSANAFIFVEVECGQKHPSTNVLKVWPYLAKKKKLRVFLVQCYLPKSQALGSSRQGLARWIGGKMEELLKNRFFYAEIMVSKDIVHKGALLKKFKRFEEIVRR